MKNLGSIRDSKDVVNKGYVDDIKKELEDKLEEIEAITNEEIDQVLSQSANE